MAATSNGLEVIAPVFNDMLPPLDELAEISGNDLDAAIYMLANGTGKARMSVAFYQMAQIVENRVSLGRGSR